MVIQQGEVRSLDEEREGFATIKGVIRAGKAGREGSWRIEGIAEVKVCIEPVFFRRTLTKQISIHSMSYESWSKLCQVQMHQATCQDSATRNQ